MTAREFNFDGLVGPTHHYAGLSPGNIASTRSAGRLSHPRRAALEGLGKMAKLHALGIPQAVLPPQPRPDLDWLRRLGWTGTDAHVIERAAREDPRLLSAAYSASSMWTANAATVIPSADANDARVHFIPANLTSEVHRSIEAPHSSRLLRAVFADKTLFVHHDPIPIAGDEGAANHTRLCVDHGGPGLEIFTYGIQRRGTPTDAPSHANNVPNRYPARQREEASRAVARHGDLDSSGVLFVQQSPDAIDAGVFHNDVVATGHRDLLFLHERAFVDQRVALARIEAAYRRRCSHDLRVVEIPSDALSLARAVETYLFNCQIVTPPDGRRVWIGPRECEEDQETRLLLEELRSEDGPFDELHFVELRESMRNGGGPACLRLRVVLNEAEVAATHSGVFFDDALHQRLARSIERYYREELRFEDLVDPEFATEARAALDAITDALGLESVYAYHGT